MAIHSSSIVHFTKTQDALIGILREGFRIKYCHELIMTVKGGFDLAVPMVSFCDLPLSMVKDHTGNYGEYGIGLSKHWAAKNGLNPVLYLNNSSSLGPNILSGLKKIDHGGKPIEKLTSEEFAMLDILRYLKNTNGAIEKDGKSIAYSFFDESEWRFVPPNEDVYPFQIGKFYENDKARFNDPLKHLRLKFEPTDISYVIVRNPAEIEKFYSLLENLFPDHWRIVTTKLFTMQQIERDF